MSGRKIYGKTKYSLRKALRYFKKHPIACLLTVAVVLVMLASTGGNDADSPEATPAITSEPREGLFVHYIDVGQGDSELIECNGEYMLIDAGTAESGYTVVKYLKALGVTNLRYVICSHGDYDHCGGLDKVLESFTADEVFVSPYDENKEAYGIFLDAVEEAGLTAQVPDMGESYTLGGAEFKFLGPTADNSDNNENSLVMKLNYGDTAFLFAGDIQYLGEQALLDSGADLKCDVLKVAHHGSYTSTSYHFLYEADPDIAVISCGKNNSYGHPHEVVLSRLSDAEVTVYRTDELGTVVVYSDGKTAERIAA